jgi:serine/threonine-protein kinase RsbW
MNAVTQRLPATVEQLPAAQAFLKSWVEQAGIDPRLGGRLALALEEVFVNVCHYAYPPDRPGEIELRILPSAERFVLDVLDDGQPFDPANLPEPDLAATLEQRAIGGLGWFLVRQMVSELRCRREQGRNLVSLVMEQPADDGHAS